MPGFFEPSWFVAGFFGTQRRTSWVPWNPTLGSKNPACLGSSNPVGLPLGSMEPDPGFRRTQAWVRRTQLVRCWVLWNLTTNQLGSMEPDPGFLEPRATKLEAIEAECARLRKDTDLMIRQSAASKLNLCFMLKMLKACEEGDFLKATRLLRLV
ncbi:hypothetical protein SLEP1_g21379 [Rubroshorea leprosula]|uniref:Uncharacterized protein n=1 Tax=Rubroshorea leprosula TaxID=152421 RepID=A0AAV5JEV5_9ROSI|nr:hypothetical protein SLEP1_g21379 [Rubroshorea leprosula]